MSLDLHQLKHFVRHFFTAKRRGHGVHSPFAYQLCENVFYNHDHFYDFELLDQIRKNLLQDDSVLEIEDFGAGSKTFKNKTRQVKSLAARGISTKKQSEILYRLINFLDLKKCVELGTSLGLNSLYMAKVNQNMEVTSVEGSKALYDFARRLAEKNGVNNIRFVHARFENVIEELANEPGPGLLYVDGNHTYEATTTYFRKFVAKAKPESVFIFDDIYWSSDMTRAWNEIKADTSVTMSIDLFYFGLIFFKPEIKEKVELKLYV